MDKLFRVKSKKFNAESEMPKECIIGRTTISFSTNQIGEIVFLSHFKSL